MTVLEMAGGKMLLCFAHILSILTKQHYMKIKGCSLVVVFYGPTSA
jgi:hypothetical protein